MQNKNIAYRPFKLVFNS